MGLSSREPMGFIDYSYPRSHLIRFLILYYVDIMIFYTVWMCKDRQRRPSTLDAIVTINSNTPTAIQVRITRAKQYSLQSAKVYDTSTLFKEAHCPLTRLIEFA